jgi:hypothetical protein
MKKSCKECAHFKKQIDVNNLNTLTKDQGLCLRFPPVPYPIPAGQPGAIAVFNAVPTVQGSDICGEFVRVDGLPAKLTN